MKATASRRALTATVGAALLLVACSSSGDCAPSSPAAGTCPDLKFQGQDYGEWHEVERPAILQELGDATYPACNADGTCDGVDLDGLGSTDVWLFEGVDPTDAVIGLREGTHTYVIFVRVGVDPDHL